MKERGVLIFVFFFNLTDIQQQQEIFFLVNHEIPFIIYDKQTHTHKNEASTQQF